MTNLLFLNGNCQKFILRISSEGFTKCCLKRGVSPVRIAKINNLYEAPKEGDIILIEKFNTLLYEVNPTENFNCICKKFNLSKEELYLVNLTYDFYPWQVIELPLKSTN